MDHQQFLNASYGELANLLAERPQGTIPEPQPLDVSPWIAQSLLQKAIRRGEAGHALRAAATLLRDAPEKLWKRLAVAVFEDIGLGSLDLIMPVLTATSAKGIRQKFGGDWLVASAVVQRMAAARKCRASDDLLMTVITHPRYEADRLGLTYRTQRELMEIVAGDGDIITRAIALFYATGTDRCPVPTMRIRKGNIPYTLEVMERTGFPFSVVELAQRGCVRMREPLSFYVALLARDGRSYLKQIETESGIWFRDTRRSANHRRALANWLTPDGLSALLEIDQDAADAALKAQPFEFGFPLRYYQENAIRAVETALSEGERSMLVAMATGTGKTKLAIALLYRLLSAKRFRRICFVVDRSALGHQTEGEFSTTKVVSGKTFAEIFGLKALGDVTPDLETKVHICTIQGLVKRVLFAADVSEAPPVDQYDLIITDECHRGYLLDREMSDAELSFRGQDDYISKYRRVLEYFDAVKIGLTATPALHTTDIFGEPIFRYSYREAVIDGFLIDHEPPIRIETALARAGITFEKDEQLDLLDTKSGKIDLTHAPDEIRFEVEQFNKRVITPEFNRVVAEELAKHIDPALPGKTLIFAATDAHADIVVDAIKKAFADAYGEIDDAAVRKITGSVDRVQNLIRSFRNDANPKIAVTVDLLTTGIDVPKIVNLVFLRRVNSRILYEQMIGRATRRCDEIGKEVFRIFDAVDLYPHLQDLWQCREAAGLPRQFCRVRSCRPTVPRGQRAQDQTRHGWPYKAGAFSRR
jgi:superfamily II DNA or RNA helicase